MAVAVALAVYNLNKPFNPHVEFLYSKRHVFHVVNRTISDVFGNKTFAISIIENHSDEDPSWSLEKAFAENFTIITTFETHEYRFGIAGNLNYTQIQSKDIREAIQAVIGEERRDLPVNKSLLTASRSRQFHTGKATPSAHQAKALKKE